MKLTLICQQQCAIYHGMVLAHFRPREIIPLPKFPSIGKFWIGTSIRADDLLSSLKDVVEAFLCRRTFAFGFSSSRRAWFRASVCSWFGIVTKIVTICQEKSS